MQTVQIGVLVQDTGEKPRTLQHWTDIGILRAEEGTDKKGRGNYRVYRAAPLYGERKYALLASALNKLRLPLGEIRHVIYADRLMYDPIESLVVNDPTHMEHAKLLRAARVEDERRMPNFVHPFAAALEGEPNVFMAFASRPHDKARPLQVSYLRQSPDLLYADSAARSVNRMMLNLMADNTSAIVLNLSKIFEPLRRKLTERELRGRVLEQHEVGTDRDDRDEHK